MTKKKKIAECLTHVKPILEKCDTIVVGPGLGVSEASLAAAEEIVMLCKILNKFVVLDADGLRHFVTPNRFKSIQNSVRCIMTPNRYEFNMLLKNLNVTSNFDLKQPSVSMDTDALLAFQQQFAELPTILLKSNEDILLCNGCIHKVAHQGSKKRCGGQGDVLTGIMATHLAWLKMYHENENTEKGNGVQIDENKPFDPLASTVVSACFVMREAAKRAFETYGRSLCSENILSEIGKASDLTIGKL